MSTLTKQDTFSSLIEAAPNNFASARATGKEAYVFQGLPAVKAEEYKFTNISKKLEQNLTDFSTAKPLPLTDAQVKAAVHEGFEGSVLVFSNGQFIPGLSSKIDEVEVSLISEKADLPIGSIANPKKDVFAALNQASFQDGLFISVPKKTQVDKAILLLSFDEANEGQVIQPRVWIEVGDFAEVTFIDQTVSVGESTYFVNEVVEVKGGINSQIHYYRLQNEGKNAIEVSTIETDIQKDGRFSSVNISLSGDMVRNNLNLNLKGSNSEGNMYGIYLLNGKSHVDNHTNVDHTIPHAESNELYKGILADQSRGVFNGKIFVRQDAQKTNAFQQNNNILLSEDATVNTKPQLEIWADDVKCSHGCTVGQLDEEALFYLQTRGIDKLQAKGLLLYAFAGEVLEKIETESFREYCDSLIQERLGSKF
ncbi:Fe-S cluster assembly protein SufD [Algoriphagus aestuariicola]|jgi:Fe-S cluster assembly protein SufD|uniref:Fe-S cluster assembly protein SufD n=1 Tax=Algoriphagus aestuariicola TaxID=1852016 RepID=A0ABS3BL19_9BACT|nr:Fe-S cluster assembly protein SufD [Algoriphagus aestuariicola]MBN7799868.1 Fe-S cluster assembly protein SufD [Algoriphagus aestuariicola]